MSAGADATGGKARPSIPYESAGMKPPTAGGLHSQTLRKLDDALTLVDFPASKNDVLRSLRNEDLDVQERRVKLHDLVGKLPQDRFDSRNDLVTALQHMPDLQGPGMGRPGAGQHG